MTVDLQSNPLHEGLVRERVVDPCVAVIFGATGDLAYRKLLPALYHLYAGGFLPRSFAIIAFASSDYNDNSYRESIRETIRDNAPDLPTGGPVWIGFSGLIRYVRRSKDIRESLVRLKLKLGELDSQLATSGNYLFYFSVPPFVYEDYAAGLGEVGLAKEDPGGGWRRLVVEKPFGTDYPSAARLNAALRKVFEENQIYRIDHYLGKETVQNILAFRFANSFIEPILNAKYVDSIQISVAETLGVGTRGSFYDATGALRDIVENHILQMISLICMDPPPSLDAESIRNEKIKVFRSIRRIDPSKVADVTVRGQYGAGKLLGRDVVGYRNEDKVAPDSKTETFAALKLFIDNWRWEGTPIYIRTGKRMAKRVTEIAIQLKNVPAVLFGASSAEDITPNIIAINVQPEEGIAVKFQAKVPGMDYRIQPVKMDFRYGSAFGPSVPEAYERLLLDALIGDTSLFARADAVEEAWRIVDPVINGWKLTNAPVYSYAPGSWGPKEAVTLIERDGRRWRRL